MIQLDRGRVLVRPWHTLQTRTVVFWLFLAAYILSCDFGPAAPATAVERRGEDGKNGSGNSVDGGGQQHVERAGGPSVDDEKARSTNDDPPPLLLPHDQVRSIGLKQHLLLLCVFGLLMSSSRHVLILRDGLFLHLGPVPVCFFVLNIPWAALEKVELPWERRFAERSVGGARSGEEQRGGGSGPSSGVDRSGSRDHSASPDRRTTLAPPPSAGRGRLPAIAEEDAAATTGADLEMGDLGVGGENEKSASSIYASKVDPRSDRHDFGRSLAKRFFFALLQLKNGITHTQFWREFGFYRGWLYGGRSARSLWMRDDGNMLLLTVNISLVARIADAKRRAALRASSSSSSYTPVATASPDEQASSNHDPATNNVGPPQHVVGQTSAIVEPMNTSPRARSSPAPSPDVEELPPSASGASGAPMVALPEDEVRLIRLVTPGAAQTKQFLSKKMWESREVVFLRGESGWWAGVAGSHTPGGEDAPPWVPCDGIV